MVAGVVTDDVVTTAAGTLLSREFNHLVRLVVDGNLVLLFSAAHPVERTVVPEIDRLPLVVEVRAFLHPAKVVVGEYLPPPPSVLSVGAEFRQSLNVLDGNAGYFGTLRNNR